MFGKMKKRPIIEIKRFGSINIIDGVITIKDFKFVSANSDSLSVYDIYKCLSQFFLREASKSSKGPILRINEHKEIVWKDDK